MKALLSADDIHQFVEVPAETKSVQFPDFRNPQIKPRTFDLVGFCDDMAIFIEPTHKFPPARR